MLTISNKKNKWEFVGAEKEEGSGGSLTLAPSYKIC
jgi:hypothetical protein